MQSRVLLVAAIAGSVTGGILLGGCSKDSAVTPSEEQRFKNPSKEMPAEARKIMQEHSAQPPQAVAPGK